MVEQALTVTYDIAFVGGVKIPLFGGKKFFPPRSDPKQCIAAVPGLFIMQACSCFPAAFYLDSHDMEA